MAYLRLPAYRRVPLLQVLAAERTSGIDLVASEHLLLPHLGVCTLCGCRWSAQVGCVCVCVCLCVCMCAYVSVCACVYVCLNVDDGGRVGAHMSARGHASVRIPGLRCVSHWFTFFAASVEVHHPDGTTAVHSCAHPPLTHGAAWKAYTQYHNSKGMDLYTASWTVPAQPGSDDGQILYYWPGTEPDDNSFVLQVCVCLCVCVSVLLDDNSFVLQPVLQWGNTPAGGGSWWGLASWFVSASQPTIVSDVIGPSASVRARLCFEGPAVVSPPASACACHSSQQRHADWRHHARVLERHVVRVGHDTGERRLGRGVPPPCNPPPRLASPACRASPTPTSGLTASWPRRTRTACSRRTPSPRAATTTRTGVCVPCVCVCLCDCACVCLCVHAARMVAVLLFGLGSSHGLPPQHDRFHEYGSPVRRLEGHHRVAGGATAADHVQRARGRQRPAARRDPGVDVVNVAVLARAGCCVCPSVAGDCRCTRARKLFAPALTRTTQHSAPLAVFTHTGSAAAVQRSSFLF